MVAQVPAIELEGRGPHVNKRREPALLCKNLTGEWGAYDAVR
jgi:hypothetical protein